MDDRPTDEGAEDSTDDQVIGEIEGADDVTSPPSRHAGDDSRQRRRRSIVIGCLLALLGGILGGAVALFIGARGADDRPQDQVEVASADAIPMNRLLFSAAPQRPTVTPDIIPAETEIVYCHYELGRLPADAQLEGSWWRDGEALEELPVHNLQRDPDTDHAKGRFELRSPPEDGSIGFRSGVYEVELSAIGHSEVTARGSFVVLPRAAQILQGGGEPEGPPVIRSLRTARDVGEEGEPIGAATQFPTDVGRVVAIFEYHGIAPGSVFTGRWYIADTEIEPARSELAIPAASGWAEVWLATGETDELPPGPYRVAIHLGDDDEALASIGFTIADETGQSNE